MSGPIAWDRLRELLDPMQRVLLTSHIRPDCDALGSELGMARLLEKLGKEVVIVNAQPTPPNLAFIDPKGRLTALAACDPTELRDRFDGMMVLDTSAWAQLGEMGDVLRETQAKKIIVDHHQSSDELQAEVFRDTSAEATGCLVVEAATHWGVPLDGDAAMPLFAAVATDTGWFHFPSTKERTYQVAAQLVAAGAVPHAIYGALYEQETLGRLRLRGVVLARTESEFGGRFVHTYIRREDFAETGAVPTDTEDLVNLTLAVKGTEFALICVEQLRGGVKLSFRSRCDLDCSQIASHFGGGGHRAAAGAFLDTGIDAARENGLAHVRQAMRDHGW